MKFIFAAFWLLALSACTLISLPVPQPLFKVAIPASTPINVEQRLDMPTQQTNKHTCTVNTAVLNFRACAGTHCTTQTWLHKGETATILDQQSPWLNVETQSGQTGWVHSKFCTGE